mmetsp:Transcript_9573/g.14336  ORF Transcript_9573/g.14336 Transcript_9573/m.14336 type:complete len:205 (+) Transcript_9573:252-866(+)|eukprot:CAMPEP_0194102362 /NCGR_PEP_ID=MMETSP0150-20130528/2981_1 /TAXON_ID=122233 /ORGANISM="Chaetoceros debilis, Strain MM31A-1" /LENGTH=204 /DNA_ID=CAMNT_0038789295 /DNA_START=186 /DNA_END=803 /DNA_ORIENTATION=+
MNLKLSVLLLSTTTLFFTAEARLGFLRRAKKDSNRQAEAEAAVTATATAEAAATKSSLSSSSEETLEENDAAICPLTAGITCNVVQDGKKCNDIIIHPGTCDQIEVEYEFKYCNTQAIHQKGHSESISFVGSISVNGGKLLEKSILDHQLSQERCRILRHVVTVNNCAHAFQADMDMQARIGGDVICSASKQHKVLRPLFKSTQ